jgi:hypothetical protein
MAPQSDSSASGDRQIPPIERKGDSTSRRVLEDVMRQTAALNAVEHGIQVSELESLVEVAHRLREHEFQLDPVVIELVRATLARQLKSTGQSSEQFSAVAQRVAQTLFENPETQERLRSLWAWLTSVK